MISVWWILPAWIFGMIIGMIAMGIFIIASEEDDREEKRRRRNHDQGGGADRGL